MVNKIIVDSLIELEKTSRSKGATTERLLDVLTDVIGKVMEVIEGDYFMTHHSSGIGQDVERRKQELLEKAKIRQISYEEGNELQGLLEKQKAQHESKGDIGGAILAGLMILFIIALLAALFGSKKE